MATPSVAHEPGDTWNGSTHKVCHSCDINLPLAAFQKYSNGSGETRWRRVCSECRKSDARLSWDKGSPEYRAARIEQASMIRIRKTYGITPDQLSSMRKEQNDLCSICGKPESRTRNGKTLRLCIDHDAETGQIRGLLCSRCNVAIGMLDHDPVLTSQAVQYLTKWQDELEGERNGEV